MFKLVNNVVLFFERVIIPSEILKVEEREYFSHINCVCYHLHLLTLPEWQKWGKDKTWTRSIVLPIQKVSQTFIKANLRPKNFCLGLIRPKVSFYKCLGYFCIGKAVTCVLYLLGVHVLSLPTKMTLFDVLTEDVKINKAGSMWNRLFV